MFDCQVTVRQGTLQGKRTTSYNGKEYYSFEGIPYAQPPVGKLRFRDPQPPENWDGVRDASKPGNKCAQMDPFRPSKLIGSEDCLYLNVHTPTLPAKSVEKLPVIFFIHGGRYLLGFGDYYKPDYFLQNNVIIVTINYRLHILGMLCLHTPEVPGNAALKDAVFALRWVKDNISNFNGDPNNITVFGESAGAGTSSSILVSKMADGLFSRHIMESGCCLSDLFIIEQDHIAKAKFVVSQLGKEIDDVQELFNFLQEADLEDLLIAVCTAEMSKEEINTFFLPVIEKSFDNVEPFFSEHPIVTLRENKFNQVPVIIGLHSHEGALFLPLDSDGNIMFRTDLEFYVPRYLSIEKGSRKEKHFAETLKNFYFQDLQINDSTKGKYLDFVSDAYFNRDIYLFAELVSKFNKDVYFYRFSYEGNMNTRVMKRLGLKGATHGDILQYQFYKKNKAENCSQKDQEVVKFLSEAWCSFAKNGKPTWSNQKFEWPSYANKYACLEIGQELSLVENPGGDRFRVWRELMKDKCKL